MGLENNLLGLCLFFFAQYHKGDRGRGCGGGEGDVVLNVVELSQACPWFLLQQLTDNKN